jgi:hypothetical protein
LTGPKEVHEDKGFKLGKAPSPNGIPNRALKHLPKRAVSLVFHIFNAVLRTYHFPPVWKHARVISILKPSKDPAQPTSYRSISLLDGFGKLFEKILLTTIRPLMDYACPVWRSAARNIVRRLQVLQSKCLRLVTGAPWYLTNRQIHEKLAVPLFADHIRALTASFDSRLTDVGKPLVRQLGRYLR